MDGMPLGLRWGLLGGAVLLAALAGIAPETTIMLLPLLLALAAGLLAWEFSSAVLVALLALITLSPEFHVGSEPSLVIALHKAGIIAIAAVLVVRRGFSGQFNGPAFAFIAALALTLVFGTLHPALGGGDIARSLLGSLAPFVPIWVRLDARWRQRVILLAAVSPLLSLLGAVPLQLLGPHSIWVAEYTGVPRLQGAGIAAYLAYLGEIGTFAAFAEYAVSGRRQWLYLAGAAYLSIVATATRVPMATALLFCLVVLAFGRGEQFGALRRLRLWLLGGGALLIGVALIGPSLLARTLADGAGQAGLNLSGRDIIWPLFADAVAQHPLFGQGIGTGRLLVPIEAVQLIGSNAVHNEYLRLSVDMGVVGVGLLVFGHLAWFRREWRFLTSLERTVICAFAIGFAVHSITDNTLIAPQATMLYAWLAAFLQRARERASVQPRRQLRSGAMRP
jgi:O-antigen ligase